MSVESKASYHLTQQQANIDYASAFPNACTVVPASTSSYVRPPASINLITLLLTTHN